MSLPRFFLDDLVAFVQRETEYRYPQQHKQERTDDSLSSRLADSNHAKLNVKAELSVDESRHASKVLRLQLGDELEVFDGSGYVGHARIGAPQGKRTSIEIESILLSPNDSLVPIKIAVAFPKGDRQRSVVEHAVELGAHEIVFLKAARSVAEPNDKSMERLNRYALESAKQCGRNRLPIITTAKDTAQFFDGETNAQHRWLAHPYRSNQQLGVKHSSQDWQPQPVSRITEPVTIAIGPEGGFTDAEVQLARRAGWNLIQLGPRILRVETAVAQSLAIAGQMIQPPNIYAPH